MPNLTYDRNKNLLSDGIFTYEYNTSNELLRVKRGGGLVAEYTYGFNGVLRSRKDAQGVVEQYEYHHDRIALVRRGRTIYEIYDWDPGIGYHDAWITGRRYRVTSDASGVRSLENANEEHHYTYNAHGLPILSRNAQGQIIQPQIKPRIGYRGWLRDPGTDLYYRMGGTWYHPAFALDLNPRVSPIIWFEVTPEQQRQDRQRYEFQARVSRRREIRRLNSTTLGRAEQYSLGVADAGEAMVTELFAMGVDLMPFDVPGTGGKPVSAIGKLRATGRGWGEIGSGMVTGIGRLPGEWADSLLSGDMRSFGRNTTDIVFLVEGGVSSAKQAARAGRYLRARLRPASARPIAAAAEAEAVALQTARSEMLATAEQTGVALSDAERGLALSRRPHLTQNPIRFVANKSKAFCMDVWNQAAYVGGNPALGFRTILRTSRGRNQRLFKPFDLTKPIADDTLLALLWEKLPGHVQRNILKNGTKIETVGQVDELLRAIWSYERNMRGTGFHAGHRADLAINLLQTRFENRMGLHLLEQYARGSNTSRQVINNLFVPQWGSANSAMGAGLTMSISYRLARYYGLRVPEGTAIRLVGVAKRRGRTR